MPIRIFGAIAIAGAVSAVFALTGAAVPRAFLAMGAALALAFSINMRPLRSTRHPLLRRTVWIAAAAVMLAAIPSDAPRGGAGAWGFAIGALELLAIAVIALAVMAAFIRIVRGIRADPDDRLLIGALAALAVFVVLFARLPPPDARWLYPFALVAGGAVARATGNIARP
jgi:hypothetical protein